MTRLVARLLFAPTLVVALAMLVKGYAEVGDGFAAGVIAGLAFLMQFVAFGERQVRRELHTRFAPVVAQLGIALALATTLLPILWGKPPLTHYPLPDEPAIHLGELELLTAFVFDIGVFMLVVGFSITGLSLLSRAESREIR
jgi:multisubunit Na+/H+ antiporter MnhB subunit